jgi:NADH:ubiquinone oxidoreductase subunit H
MAYRLAAELVLMLHLGFVVFVVAGAFAAVRARAWLVAHLAALAWGAGIEFSGLVCPLTWLENYLRMAAGASGYAGGFVEHYLLAMLYPAGLTRTSQLALGCAVLAINALLYGWLLWRRVHPKGRPTNLLGGSA